MQNTLIVLVPGTPGSELWFRPTDPNQKRTLLFSSSWKWTFSALRRSAAYAGVLGQFGLVSFPLQGGDEGKVEHGGLFPARKFGLPRRVMPDLAHFGGYDTLLKAIGAEPGFAVGHNVHTFAFDWRKSVLENGALLAAFCQQLTSALDASTGEKTKAVLIGHSAGGIVSKIALHEKPELFGPRKPLLITLGTPWKGTYKAAKFVVNGPPGLGEPGRTAARQMPGLAELILREEHSWCGLPPTDLRSSPLVVEALAAGTDMNCAAIDQILDAPIGRHLAIVGLGYPTEKRARRKVFLNPQQIRSARKTDGDGAVVLSSASPPPNGTSSLFPVRGDHENLPSNPAVVERILIAIRNHDATTQLNPVNEAEVA